MIECVFQVFCSETYDVFCYVLNIYTHPHTHAQFKPLQNVMFSLMIKYQRTAHDILLVEQDGSTGMTKVGYCSTHPAYLLLTWGKNMRETFGGKKVFFCCFFFLSCGKIWALFPCRESEDGSKFEMNKK